MTDRLAVDDGVELAFRVVGCGSRDVFLIHGWLLSSLVYDDLIGKLDTAGLRLIIPDLRGAGRSSRPDHGYTIERYAADVLAIADRLGSRSFVAVGHAMGGQIAEFLAATNPSHVAGLMLLCPIPSRGMVLPEPLRTMFRGCGQNRVVQQAVLALACKELPDAKRERLLDDSDKVPSRIIEQSFDAWVSGYSNMVPTIKAPTLVVGTDDPFLPHALLYETVVAPIPGARLAVVPGPGHYVQVERPGETAALLQAFLAGLH